MGWKFRSRRSIKVLPGVRLNMGQKGITSVSIGGGGKFFRSTTNISKRGVKKTFTIVGIGSFTEQKKHSSSGKTLTNTSSAASDKVKSEAAPYVDNSPTIEIWNPKFYKSFLITSAIALVTILLITKSYSSAETLAISIVGALVIGLIVGSISVLAKGTDL